MATIRDIAAAAGVSRGTVDRVLHKRGRVSPEVEAKVEECARLLGWEPNTAAQMLASRKRERTIGVLMPSVGNAFFDEVRNGVMKGADEHSELGFSVLIDEVKGYEPEVHLAALRRLVEAGVSGIAAATVDHPLVTGFLAESGVPFLAFNSDITAPGKLCYVGSDYRGKGSIDADLLRLAKPEGARVAVIRGSRNMKGHGEVVSGFVSRLEETGYSFEIVSDLCADDDDEKARGAALEALASSPDTFFITAAGAAGCARALRGKGLLLFTSDDTPPIRSLVREGVAAWTVCQEPFDQGRAAVAKLVGHIIGGKPQDDLITKNTVKVAANIDT